MRPLPLPDPALGDASAADAIETIIVPRLRDIGPFEVRRALPAARRQMIGPFIFLDHSVRPRSFRASSSTCGRIRISGWQR